MLVRTEYERSGYEEERNGRGAGVDVMPFTADVRYSRRTAHLRNLNPPRNTVPTALARPRDEMRPP
jgi:hypothetical protein